MPLRIYLIGRSHLDFDALNRFLLDHNASWKRSNDVAQGEEIVEIAGRLCYMSFGKRQKHTNKDFIHHLLRKGHESVLEHVNWTFLVCGVSRAFTHQLVRHRVGFSFSQLSQQYYDQTEAEFIKPPILAKFPKACAAWEQAIHITKKSYREILGELATLDIPSQNGISKKEARRLIRSSARSVLPNATETKIVMTANARAIRNFLCARGSIPGDEEMRMVCAELLKLLKDEAPAIFMDFEIETLGDGSPIVIHREVKEKTK